MCDTQPTLPDFRRKKSISRVAWALHTIYYVDKTTGEQLKQLLVFWTGMCKFDIASDLLIWLFPKHNHTISCLFGLFHTKVEALLADKRVEEALTLAKNFRKVGMTKDQFTKVSWLNLMPMAVNIKQ